MEFAKFTEPLYRLGVLTMDDLNEIKGMTKWFDIMNKITDVITENNLVAKVSIDSVSSNYFVNLIGFEFDEGQGSDIEKEGDTLEQEAKKQASKEQEKIEEPQETKQEAPKEEIKKDNPFEKGIDISDDDLPF